MAYLQYKSLCTKELNCNKYYNVNKVYSYAKVDNNKILRMVLAIIMGARGLGKTTQWGLKARDNWINNEEEFVWVRRYGKETKLQKELPKQWINNVTFQGDGNEGGQWYIDKHRFGYLIPLSKQADYKSGYDFSKVTLIIFDEGIIKQTRERRYIKDEVEELFELMSTITRERTNVLTVVIGNNMEYFNPYSEYFNLKARSGITADVERGIFLEYATDSQEYKDAQEKTGLYRLTQGTAYHSYHYNNEALDTSDIKLSTKPQNARLIVRYVLNNYTLDVYNRDGGLMWVEGHNKVKIDDKSIELLKDDLPNYPVVKIQKKWYWYIKLYDLFFKKRLKFVNESAYHLCNTLFDLVGH